MALKFKVKYLIILIVIFILQVNVYGAVDLRDGEMFIDSKNYTKLKEESYTFGTNIWHSRYIDNHIDIPIYEVWVSQPLNYIPDSNSTGQPIILKDVIIGTSGNYVYVLNKKDGNIISQGDRYGIELQKSNTTHKSLYSSPLYISNDDGWLNKDCMPRICIGTRVDGKMYCFRLNKDQLELQWVYNSSIKSSQSGGIVSSPNIIFDNNKYGYIVFGNEEGKIFIINIRDGKPIENGIIALGGKISSSPIVIGADFNQFLIGVNKGDEGYLYGGYIFDGRFNSMGIERSTRIQQGIPTSVAYQPLNNSDGLLLYSDRVGNIYGKIIDKVGRIKTLFDIGRYRGLQSLNTPTIVNNRYGIFNFNRNNRSVVVCIDIKKAIKGDKDYLLWETSNTFADGPSYVGATGISIEEGSGYSNIVLVGDEGKTKKPNLKAFYVDRAKGNKPIAVDNAFIGKSKNNEYERIMGLKLDGGVKSEPAFADDVFIVMDGKGRYHCYSLRPKDNLYINRVTNNSRILKADKKYSMRADIGSSCDKDLKDVDIRLYGFGELLSYKKVDIPKSGTNIDFEYMTPSNYPFQMAKLRVEVNMKERVIRELFYGDNIKSIDLPYGEINDLEVVEIEESRFQPGMTSMLRVLVKNNSHNNLKDVDLSISIDNGIIKKSKKINLLSKGEGYISFRVTAPNHSCRFNVKAIINENKDIKEVDYENNTKKRLFEVKVLGPPGVCKEVVRWKEVRFSHYKTVNEEYIDKKGNVKKRTTKVPVFIDKEFYAKMVLKANTYPKEIKSGYGFEVNVTTNIDTNYDRKHRLVGAQRVEVFAEDSDKPIVLVPELSTKNLRNTWKFPVNDESVLKKKNHYIPVNWPDGEYNIVVKAFDAISPGGEPCRKLPVMLRVVGHMYMDDLTS